MKKHISLILVLLFALAALPLGVLPRAMIAAMPRSP